MALSGEAQKTLFLFNQTPNKEKHRKTLDEEECIYITPDELERNDIVYFIDTRCIGYIKHRLYIIYIIYLIDMIDIIDTIDIFNRYDRYNRYGNVVI